MDGQLEDIADITLEGDSRSARWKKLKGYLRDLAQEEDIIGDRLASLKEEIEHAREDGLKLAERLQTLSDLANEEVQREISLTLNDDDFDIVVDAAPQPPAATVPDAEKEAVEATDLANELQNLPSIGAANAKKIADYIQSAGQERAQQLALLLAEIRRDRTSQQPLFGKEGE